MRVNFVLFPVNKKKDFFDKFKWIGKTFEGLFPFLKYDLESANIEVKERKYITIAFFSALLYGFFFFFIVFDLLFLKDKMLFAKNVYVSILVGIIFTILFFLLHIYYPKIMAKNLAVNINNDLIFALKTMQIMIASGISLFEAIRHVANSNYGTVTKEFKKIVNNINSGISEIKALEMAALKTKSDYFKKTLWQMITSLRSGASLAGVLKNVIELLLNYQVRAIKSFAAELNLWILLYLLFAAAMPTLGIVMLTIFSTISGSNIGIKELVFFIGFSFIVQFIIIGFVKTRLPKVFVS